MTQRPGSTGKAQGKSSLKQNDQQTQNGGTGGKHAQQGDHTDHSPSSASHRSGGHGHKQPDAGLNTQSKPGGH